MAESGIEAEFQRLTDHGYAALQPGEEAGLEALFGMPPDMRFTELADAG
jgi:hypothetical protein